VTDDVIQVYKCNNVFVTVVSQVNLDQDGVLHIISADRACQYKVSLHETSLVSLLSHDLLPGVPGLEILVAAADGALLCLKADSENDEVNKIDVNEIKTVAWPAEQKSHNDFTFSEFVSSVVYLSNSSSSMAYLYNSYVSIFGCCSVHFVYFV